MGYGFEDCWRIGEGRKNVLKLYHNILNVCSCLFTKILTYIDLIPISIKSNKDVLFFFWSVYNLVQLLFRFTKVFSKIDRISEIILSLYW